jgi:hypothetical protein
LCVRRASEQQNFAGLVLQAVQETEPGKMPLTREFKETVTARAERDPAFREALLIEVTEQLLAAPSETQ